MVAIRRSRAKDDGFGPDPALDLPQGAHLKVKSVRLFPPRFHDETGDLWVSNVSLRLVVVDDFTEEGNADGLEFSDRLELKVDLDVLEELGLDDDAVKNGNIEDFSEEVCTKLLDQSSWTIRDNSKPDMLNLALFGERWTSGRLSFREQMYEDQEFIAKVKPRTGKRPGSYCAWDSFMSLHRPKKKKQAAKAASEIANNAEFDNLPPAPFESADEKKAK